MECAIAHSHILYHVGSWWFLLCFGFELRSPGCSHPPNGRCWYNMYIFPPVSWSLRGFPLSLRFYLGSSSQPKPTEFETDSSVMGAALSKVVQYWAHKRVFVGRRQKNYPKMAMDTCTTTGVSTVISFSDSRKDERFLGCHISFNGTDCRICEPAPFSPRWYSHKFKAAGVRYEIVISIWSASIVSAVGSYPCGEFSDVKIFRKGLKKHLDDNEQVITDSGYTDICCIQPPGSISQLAKPLCRIRARNEVVNSRLKQFPVLSKRFPHDLELNSDCFYAVLNVTFLCVQEEPMLK